MIKLVWLRFGVGVDMKIILNYFKNYWVKYNVYVFFYFLVNNIINCEILSY